MGGSFSLPQSDHIAMETRNARAQIMPNGRIIIYTSSQGPYSIKKLLSKYYNIPEGNIVAKVPFVGGGFGGKAPIQLELIAYLASKAVNGKLVRVANSREDDIKTSPCKIGVEANLKIGATNAPIQKAFVDNWSFQCRYCTSGFLMVCHALANIHPDANDHVIEQWLQSNLCRCTGYEEIKDAIKSVIAAK